MRSKDTAILIDAGISYRELARRMGAAGLNPDSLDAVIISHGHNDHVRGISSLCSKRDIPIFANRGTAVETKALREIPSGPIRRFTTGAAFSIGDMSIEPFPVPHDTAEPVGFVITDGRVKSCFATDLGSVTPDALISFSDCDVVVLESNYDVEMLLQGPYPEFLKARVNGPLGHLSNAAAAELIREIAHRGLKRLVLAHLSRTNNRPGLPLETVAKALGSGAPSVEVSLGWQDRAGELLTTG